MLEGHIRDKSKKRDSPSLPLTTTPGRYKEVSLDDNPHLSLKAEVIRLGVDSRAPIRPMHKSYFRMLIIFHTCLPFQKFAARFFVILTKQKNQIQNGRENESNLTKDSSTYYYVIENPPDLVRAVWLLRRGFLRSVEQGRPTNCSGVKSLDLSRPETIPNQGSRPLIIQQTCRGQFSAVSKPIFSK